LVDYTILTTKITPVLGWLISYTTVEARQISGLRSHCKDPLYFEAYW